MELLYIGLAAEAGLAGINLIIFKVETVVLAVAAQDTVSAAAEQLEEVH
jgi:hypothetical protein